MSRTLRKDTIAKGSEGQRIAFGDYVESDRHGHQGRVYKFEMLTNSDASWLAGLSVPITIEETQEPMICILCHDGGAVSVPAASCSIIPDIKDFTHLYAEDYFGKAA